MIKIKKFKNILNRAFALFCSVLIIVSCIVVPVSATSVEENDIVVYYTSSKNKIWFPKSAKGVASSASNYCSTTHDSEDFSILISPKTTFYDERNENGILTHGWSVLNFEVTPSTDLSSVDFSQYDLVIDVSVNNTYSYDGLGLANQDLENFEPTLGITDESILNNVGGAVPSIGDIHGYDLPYDNTFGYFEGNTFKHTYTFTDTDTIASLLDGSYTVQMPFGNTGSDILILYKMILKYTGTSTDDTTTGNNPSDYVSDVDFLTPALYDYDYPFNVMATVGSTISKFSVMDFYSNNYSSGSYLKMRDYTNKFIINSLPVMAYQYDTLLGIGFLDGVTYDDYFTDTLFDMFTVTVPARVLDIDNLLIQEDMSLQGFRMEFYIAFPNGFTYSSYKEFLDSANSFYYGCEPFAFEIGGISIPYEYFKFSYDANQTALRATLEFDGQNTTHRYYMNLISNDYTNTLRLTFSLPSQTDYAGCMVGFTEGGFWQKYEETPIVTPDIPDTPTQDSNGGYSYEDLQDAYNKGLNTGRNENTNTNHVFGLFNGLFSAVFGFYSIVANGITIGGISVGMMISSIVVICAVWLVAKRFI